MKKHEKLEYNSKRKSKRKARILTSLYKVSIKG